MADPPQSRQKWSTIPWRFFAGTTLGLAVVGLASGTLTAAGQLTAIGVLVSVLLGIGWECWYRLRARQLSLLETPFYLAHDTEVFEHYRRLSQSLLAISHYRDPIFRSVALEQIADIAQRVSQIADGTLVFEGTETWRIVYEKLLRSPGLYLYRSVAWVKTANYWQDEPGRKSMAVNFELHDNERLNIERIAVIADQLWPTDAVWPAERIRQWLHDQHLHGIWIKFVRESMLKKEPELICDMGIYGSRALGIQELDDECSTVKFTLTFDFNKVAEAESRWNRLAVYAESYADYLDRFELPR